MSTPLYPRLLGIEWDKLDASVRQMHSSGSPIRASGNFQLSEASGPWSGFVRGLSRLPPAGVDVATELTVTPIDKGETWVRRFGTATMRTHQREHEAGILAERSGCIELRIRLERKGGGILYRQVGAALCLGRARLPLPSWLSPRVTGAECPAGGTQGVLVRVTIESPFGGQLIAYKGEIAVKDATA